MPTGAYRQCKLQRAKLFTTNLLKFFWKIMYPLSDFRLTSKIFNGKINSYYSKVL